MNYAARLLGATSRLGLRRVTSQLVAPHLGAAARLAESVELKGFAGLQPVYTY